MEFINKYKYYLIFGIIFIIGIIMLIIGIKSRNNVDIVDNYTLYYIKLMGDNKITIYQGEEYIEPGYRGYDDNNNDLTNKVSVINNIDNNVVGVYQVIYSLKDIVKEREVEVIKKEPGSTYIHLYGDVNMFLYVGDEYIEKNCEVIDTVDGSKLKDKIKITNNVNTSKAGVYKVTYTVTNSSGITTTAVRTVIVMDSEMSVTLNNTNYTNSNVKINIYINDDMFDYLLLPDGNKVTDKIYTYEVSENGNYKFIMYNKKNKNIEKSITVNNINKTKPSGSCSGSYKDGKSVINIKAQDDIGISRYEIDGANYTSNQITINKELKTVNISIYDKANNSTSISCNLEDKNIKYEETFTMLKYSHPNGYSFDYLLRIPSNAKNDLPLIVYLHGDGEVNNPNALEYLYQIKYMKNYTKTPFIFIAPVTKEKSWTNGSIPSSLKGLIDKTIKDYSIDKSRIYIIGFSRGAIGTWYMLNKYPNFFKAAVPVSCCPPSQSDDAAKNTSYTKIMAISGDTGDSEVVYNNCMNQFVNKINKLGGDANKVTYKGKTHYTISGAIDYDNMFGWLLQQ